MVEHGKKAKKGSYASCPLEVIHLAQKGDLIGATDLLCKKTKLNSEEAFVYVNNVFHNKIIDMIPNDKPEITIFLKDEPEFKNALLIADIDYRDRINGYVKAIEDYIAEEEKKEQERMWQEQNAQR